MIPVKILRKSDVIANTGISNTVLYGLIADGLFPPVISLGGSRSVGFIEYEVNTVMVARSTGYDNDKIKGLVTRLIEQRQEVLNELLLQLCA